MPTAEIHDANGNYAGYAKFGANGEFQGTYAGYGRNGGAAARNGASRVENAINTAPMRAARRERAGGQQLITRRRRRNG